MFKMVLSGNQMLGWPHCLFWWGWWWCCVVPKDENSQDREENRSLAKRNTKMQDLYVGDLVVV